MRATDEYVAMYETHERGEVNAVRKLLKAHPELEEIGPDDGTQTWLHVAAKMGHVPLAKFWLGRGYDAKVNLRRFSLEHEGLNTPLHFAKDAAMTRYLLSAGSLGRRLRTRRGHSTASGDHASGRASPERPAVN